MEISSRVSLTNLNLNLNLNLYTAKNETIYMVAAATNLRGKSIIKMISYAS